MNIVKEDVDGLTANLIVQIAKEDYEGKVKNALEKYRKTAKIPGFRPGNVPAGMIQKQYGKALLVEELNKLANDGVYNFISNNKIKKSINKPLPVNTKTGLMRTIKSFNLSK